MKKRASGGKPKGNLYNAAGSPAAKSAEDTTNDGFKKGGHVKKRASGGNVEGEADHGRMDKRRRGGSVRKRASGGSPYSAAHGTSGVPAHQGGHIGERD